MWQQLAQWRELHKVKGSTSFIARELGDIEIVSGGGAVQVWLNGAIGSKKVC